MRKVLYLLGELTDDDVEWLLANGERRVIAPGLAIIEEGRPSSGLFIVLDGECAATVAALPGRTIERLVCGAIVGEMSFVDSRPPSATVRARGHALVLAIPRDALAAHLNANTAFAARFYRSVALFLSDRLRGKVEMLSGQLQLEDDTLDQDELAPEQLDTLYLAGTRFDRMLRRLVEE